GRFGQDDGGEARGRYSWLYVSRQRRDVSRGGVEGAARRGAARFAGAPGGDCARLANRSGAHREGSARAGGRRRRNGTDSVDDDFAGGFARGRDPGGAHEDRKSVV